MAGEQKERREEMRQMHQMVVSVLMLGISQYPPSICPDSCCFTSQTNTGLNLFSEIKYLTFLKYVFAYLSHLHVSVIQLILIK